MVITDLKQQAALNGCSGVLLRPTNSERCPVRLHDGRRLLVRPENLQPAPELPDLSDAWQNWNNDKKKGAIREPEAKAKPKARLSSVRSLSSAASCRFLDIGKH